MGDVKPDLLDSCAAVDAQAPPHSIPELMTKKEVLETLSISSERLWQWCRTDRFPRPLVMPGKGAFILFRRDEVAKWFEALPRRKYKGQSDGIAHWHQPSDAIVGKRKRRRIKPHRARELDALHRAEVENVS